MSFIDVIEHDQAQGPLKEIYDGLVRSRGKLADVHKIQSLNPKSILAHMDLYMTIMYGKSPLKRATREMMAVVVSAANQCQYCQVHHAEALNHYWKDEEKVQRLREDFTNASLAPLEILWCQLAFDLTTHPSGIDEQRHITPLKKAGCSDRAILDATLVIAYFNFVNRMVLGLGVTLEADHGKGYRYE